MSLLCVEFGLHGENMVCLDLFISPRVDLAAVVVSTHSDMGFIMCVQCVTCKTNTLHHFHPFLCVSQLVTEEMAFTS